MDVVSPVSGRVAAIHPAFAVATDQGGVLVHLGIDTVTLRGRGFTVMVRKDTSMSATSSCPGTPQRRKSSPWRRRCS